MHSSNEGLEIHDQELNDSYHFNVPLKIQLSSYHDTDVQEKMWSL